MVCQPQHAAHGVGLAVADNAGMHHCASAYRRYDSAGLVMHPCVVWALAKQRFFASAIVAAGKGEAARTRCTELRKEPVTRFL